MLARVVTAEGRVRQASETRSDCKDIIVAEASTWSRAFGTSRAEVYEVEPQLAHLATYGHLDAAHAVAAVIRRKVGVPEERVVGRDGSTAGHGARNIFGNCSGNTKRTIVLKKKQTEMFPRIA